MITPSPTRTSRFRWVSFVAIALCVLSICGRLRAQTLSDGTFVYSFSNTATIVKYVGTSTTVEVPSFFGGIPVVAIGEGAFGGQAITSVKIDNGVTSIGVSAFSYCSDLTNVDFGLTVTNIDPLCFWSCSSLQRINLPESLNSLGDSAFYFCSAVGSVNLPASLTQVGPNAFAGCSAITNIIFENGLTNLGAGAFLDCTSLSAVNIPNGMTAISEWAFGGCTSLTNIDLPESIVSIGDNALWGCTSLTNILLPNSLTTLGNGAFQGCTGFTNFAISKAVTSIGSYAFHSCTGLRLATIPPGVTNIGAYAFAYCTNISTFTIPASVLAVGDDAFAYCSHLTSAYFQTNPPPTFGKYVFGAYGLGFSIYYPSTASGWATPFWRSFYAKPYLYVPFGVPFLQFAHSPDSITPSFTNLLIGTNYQLLVSTNLANWTNSGAPFSAQNSTVTNALTFSTTNSPRLFFRLESTP
jgi:hypothetical protein